MVGWEGPDRLIRYVPLNVVCLSITSAGRRHLPLVRHYLPSSFPSRSILSAISAMPEARVSRLFTSE